MTAEGSGKAKAGQIGKAIRIKGKLKGEEDLIVEGKVEGTISFKNNHLTLECSAVIKADVDAKDVTIKGDMTGNTVATGRAELTREAKVAGDIRAPRLVVEEGAKFRGAVYMDVPLPPGLLAETSGGKALPANPVGTRAPADSSASRPSNPSPRQAMSGARRSQSPSA